MNDPNDRDRQQRELTEELRHDAVLRATHKRLQEEQRQTGTIPVEDPTPERPSWPSRSRLLSAQAVYAWAQDVATQQASYDAADGSLR